MLLPMAGAVSREFFCWWTTDPDLDALRELSCFGTLLDGISARHAAPESEP